MDEIIRKFKARRNIQAAQKELESMRTYLIEDYISRQMASNERYANPLRINQYEYRVFSQFGEDGIIHEIFERIGRGKSTFVEIGSADGMENNTTALLFDGWKGFWIEGDLSLAVRASKTYAPFIARKKLKINESFVTVDTIEKTFKQLRIPLEPDLLAIDIDGNDYWIWKALDEYKPRVVVIEYNGSWGPHIKWIMPYNPKHRWDGSMYFGASLMAYTQLGTSLGYALIGTDFAGVNAFFVRKNLLENKFLAPYTSRNHYEYPKYFLYTDHTGHPRTPRVAQISS